MVNINNYHLIYIKINPSPSDGKDSRPGGKSE